MFSGSCSQTEPCLRQKKIAMLCERARIVGLNTGRCLASKILGIKNKPGTLLMPKIG